MTGYYWIKFYHEVLDDAKMAVLPDRLWRRFFELCLLAGTLGIDGILPNTQKIAWRLRMQTDDLSMDMTQLVAIGLIQQLPDGWLICKFAKRQEPAKDKDRKAQQREREQKRIYYGDDVTNSSRNVTQINRLTDKRREDIEETTTSFPINNLSISTANAVTAFNDNGYRKCSKLYTMITNQPMIPTTSPEAYQELEAILDHYKGDMDAAIADGKQKFMTWCSTKGKNGKPYSRTNTAWLGKWIGELSAPPELSKFERDQQELAEIARKTEHMG